MADTFEGYGTTPGTSVVIRASTGLKEYYKDNKLIGVEIGSSPSSVTPSGGLYLDISPSQTIQGGYTISTDTSSGGTKVIELPGTPTATKEQFEQGAFGVTSYDYPMTVKPENRVGMVEKNIQTAQTPTQTIKPTAQYTPTTTDKYLPLVNPITPLNQDYISKNVQYTPQTGYTVTRQNFFSFDKGKPGFDNPYVDKFLTGYGAPFILYTGYKGLSGDIATKENLKSYGAYSLAIVTFPTPLRIFTTPLAVSRAYKDIGRYGGGEDYYNYYNSPQRLEISNFMERRATEMTASTDIKGKWEATDTKQLMSDVFGGVATLTPKEKEILAYEVSQKYGYENAEFAIRETQFREQGEFVSLIGANALSNRWAGVTYMKSLEKSKALGLSPIKSINRAITSSMLIGGGLEGAYTVYNYETSRYGRANPLDVGIGAVLGGASASTTQFLIDVPPVIISKGITKVMGSGLTSRTALSGTQKGFGTSAYILDPISEPLGDFVDFLSGSQSGVRVRVTTPTFSRTVSYTSAEGGVYSFTFGRTKAQTTTNNYGLQTTTTNLPSMTRTQNNVPYSEVFNVPRTREFSIRNQTQNNVFNNPLPNPLPNTNPNTLPTIIDKTNPLPVPFTQNNVFNNPLPNPLPNTNPYTNPFVNTFVGGIPAFVPPIRGGRGSLGGFNVRTKQKRGYVPSLTAIGLNIRAKKGRKIDVGSGLSIRPII